LFALSENAEQATSSLAEEPTLLTQKKPEVIGRLLLLRTRQSETGAGAGSNKRSMIERFNFLPLGNQGL
jgi:hypothetical protein